MKTLITTIILLMCSTLLLGQWHIVEGFEDTTSLPAGWSYFDDGDGQIWHAIEHTNAHSGAKAAFVDNFLPNQNEDWLITPQLNITAGDMLEFYTRAWYGTENLQVYVSTTTPQVNSFTTLLLNMQDIGTAYQFGSAALDSYAGMDIYLGFLWECETYGVLVDDIRVGQQEIIEPALNLPGEISFYLSQTYMMDFSEFVVVTDPAQATLSAADNPNITVTIDGFNVSFASAGFVGSEDILFTLTDNLSGLTADATLEVNVLPDPAADLYIAEIISPRTIEYLNLPLIPEIVVGNAGTAVYENDIEIALSVFDVNNELLYGDQLLSYIELGSTETVSLSFNSAFSPSSEEELRFVFAITTADDNPANNSLESICTIIMRETAGGPDDFGYRFFDSNNPLGPEYNWIDISASGESTIMYNVPSFAGDDNFSEPIPLGFAFPFYGQSYASAYVDINGEILLAPNTWYEEYPHTGWNTDGNVFNYMYPIPGYTQMPALIAVYWDDLHADQGTGDVYFESFGSEPDRYTVIQWDNLRFHTGTNPVQYLKFQVILHENGEIKMQYHTVATSQTGASIPHDFGQSATVAIQNDAANIGLPYLRELVEGSNYQGVEPAGNLLHDELAILFYSGEDTQAPVLTHEPLGNTFDTELSALVNIVDMSLPLDAKIYYDSGSGWQEQSPGSIAGQNYSFELEALPVGATINYYFEAEDTQGNIGRLPENAPAEYFSFQILPSANAKILLAYSGTQDWRRVELPVYQEALDELEIAYDIWDWQEHESYVIPAQYEGVLAYANTGTANDQMQYFATALTNYLDLGTDTEPKNIWFSSDGLAANQHAHPNSSAIRRMMSGYFRTSYVPSGFGGGSNGLAGPDSYDYSYGTILALPGTPVGTVDEEYAVSANSPDCIFPNDAAGDPYYDEVPYPEIGANYIYAFEDGPINGQAYLYHGVAATAVETPSFRSLYFSFDFSQLTQIADRLEWMEDLMNWWEISAVSNAEEHAPSAHSGLDNIYPNPFNPSTTIRYYVAKTQPVKLVVFNLKGQVINTLVNAPKNAGSHTVNWDGKDDNGRPVSSGIYFLRMTTNDSTQTRKLTMIK